MPFFLQSHLPLNHIVSVLLRQGCRLGVPTFHTGAPVPVLAALLPAQLPAWEAATSPGVPATHVGDGVQILASAWPRPAWENEPEARGYFCGQAKKRLTSELGWLRFNLEILLKCNHSRSLLEQTPSPAQRSSNSRHGPTCRLPDLQEPSEWTLGQEALENSKQLRALNPALSLLPHCCSA